MGFSSSVSAQIPSYIPKDSLVGWWPFNGNANDESGKGNNGKVTGAKLTTDRNGNSNQCYSFDGVNDYVDCGSSKSLNPTGNFTVSLWINANNFTNDHGLISNFNNGGGIDLITSADNSIPPLDKIRWMDQGGFLFTTSLTEQKWYHLIAIFDATNKEKSIYLDGKLFAKGKSNISTIKSSDINMFIGSHLAAIVNYWSWDGKIDDVCMWNRALDSNEVKSIYSGTNSSANLNNDYSESRIKYFPNPVNDILNIQGVHTISNYQITNAIGQTVMLGKLTEKIDVSALNSGMYLLITETGTLRFTKE